MSRIERIIANSSFGTKSAQAARASVAPSRASRVVARATETKQEESSRRRDTE
jgi:hypothetical protein